MIVCNCAKPILVLVRKNDVVEYRVTGISTSNANTPKYTFSSSEAGTIIYGVHVLRVPHLL